MKYVIKRDGQKVLFDASKISNAIKKAMDKVGTCDEEDYMIPDAIANDVARRENESMTVEEIQDIVEAGLVGFNLYEVAKEYILYRDARNKVREQNSKIFRDIIDKVDCKTIENANANVNEHAFDGRKKEASDMLQKYMAIHMNMPEKISEFQQDGRIYEHDLSEYNVGSHNCLFIDFDRLFQGFTTRNGSVRGPGSFSTACQLFAVGSQCQSQVQFGGVGSAHVDFDLAPYVAKSFIKHFKKGMYWLETSHDFIGDLDSKVYDPFADIDFDDISDTEPINMKTINGEVNISAELIYIDNDVLKANHPAAYAYALSMLEEEGRQACQGLYHNLNTLESRAGGQVPFTSINLGRDTSTEGRLVSKWLMQASLDGIGKYHTTSIFPISIFSYKKGVNANPGDPNYDLKKLALKSLSKRIYPNWVNGDWSQAHEDESNPDTYMATMGCVEGSSTIDWKRGVNGEPKHTTFEQFWTMMRGSDNADKSVGTHWSRYIDLDDIYIRDSVSGWVPCLRLIRNVSTKWYAFSFSNGSYLVTTDDHPFHIIPYNVSRATTPSHPMQNDRVWAKNVSTGMKMFGDVEDPKTGKIVSDIITVTNVTKLAKHEEYSYDVTTASDHFTVNGVYSYNCRTMVGYDRHGLGYSKVGRGNNVPITMILPKLAIECGIVTGERTEPDLELFNAKFEELLQVTEQALLERYRIMISQSPKSGPFMYMNGTIKDADKCEDTVENSLKHNSLAFGFIGIAETCQALFGKNHASGDERVYNFALNLVERIYNFAQEASERNDLNFVCYATPAESLCRTALNKLRKDFGILPGVTDREYITNSFHVPVWEKVSIFDKLRLEAPFTKFATGGTITYVELDSTFMQNVDAVEEIIDYAFTELDIPYLAFNFPIDTCMDCGYSAEFNDHCPQCGSHNIEQLRRVTGYLTTDYSHFNDGKKAEVEDRVKHSAYQDFSSDNRVELLEVHVNKD